MASAAAAPSSSTAASAASAAAVAGTNAATPPLPPLPPDAKLRDVPPSELAALLPHAHTISVYRHRSFESRGIRVRTSAAPAMGGGASSADTAGAASSSSPPASRRPSASFVELVYPFSSSARLREQYERFETGRVRLGLLLEDLDALAGDVLALHCGVPPGAAVGEGGDPSAAPSSSSSSSAPPAEGRVYLTAALDSMTWGWIDPRGGGEREGKGGENGSGSTSGNSGNGDGPRVRPVDLRADEDLRVTARVAWAEGGASSAAEVVLELAVRPRGEDAGWVPAGACRFVMVARDRGGRVAARAGAVPRLAPETPGERRVFEQAAARQAERRAARERRAAQRRRAEAAGGAFGWVGGGGGGEPAPLPLPPAMLRPAPLAPAATSCAALVPPGGSAWPPPEDEVALVYGMMSAAVARTGGGGGGGSGSSSSSSSSSGAPTPTTTTTTPKPPPPPPVPMRHTRLSHVALMHRQDRNTSGRVFGGHLLRLAFETAYAAAEQHAQRGRKGGGRHSAASPAPARPRRVAAAAVSDVAFLSAVPIGAVLQFSAVVAFVDQAGGIRVAVRASRRGGDDEGEGGEGSGEGGHSDGHSGGGHSGGLVTNTFSFLFVVRDEESVDGQFGPPRLAAVEPETLEEAAEALAAYRQQRKLLRER